MDLIGDKWSLIIIRDIVIFGKKYYHEFIKSDEGIATNILADRLLKLEQNGVISKTEDQENKKKFIYTPTKKGLDLIPIIIEMVQWSAKYDPGTGAPPSEIKKIKENKNNYIQNIRSKFEP